MEPWQSSGQYSCQSLFCKVSIFSISFFLLRASIYLSIYVHFYLTFYYTRWRLLYLLFSDLLMRLIFGDFGSPQSCLRPWIFSFTVDFPIFARLSFSSSELAYKFLKLALTFWIFWCLILSFVQVCQRQRFCSGKRWRLTPISWIILDTPGGLFNQISLSHSGIFTLEVLILL